MSGNIGMANSFTCILMFVVLTTITGMSAAKKRPKEEEYTESVLSGALAPVNMVKASRPEPDDTCLDCMCGVQSSNHTPGCGIENWWVGDGQCGRSGCILSRRQCRCGPYLMTEKQFEDCSATTELPRDTWETCASNNDCARMCLREFMANHALECTGKTDSKKVTCEDFARMLYGGVDGCKKKKTKLFGRAVNRCTKS